MSRFPASGLFRWTLIFGVGIAIGCSPKPDQPAEVTSSKKSLPMRVLVVDDPSLAEELQRQWSARSEGQLQLGQLTSTEFRKERRSRLGADLIFYPSDLLGELAGQNLVAPLDPEELADPSLARSDIFPLLMDGEARWGDARLAVPFGSPQMLLLYHPDQFAERGWSPPTTWVQYQEYVAELGAEGRENSEAPLATLEPLGSGWAARTFLARAAAYVRHPSQYSALFELRTMKPLIDREPFVRALTELLETAKRIPAASHELNPLDVYREFVAGRTTMAISWPGPLDEEIRRDAGEPAFAELPGSSQAYNFRAEQWEDSAEETGGRVSVLCMQGRLGSVTQECRQMKDAKGMLLFLCSGEIGRQLSSASPATTLFRASQLDAAAAWSDPALSGATTRHYAEEVQSALNRTYWLSCVRVPGADRYMRVLDEAIQNCLRDEVGPEEALRSTAAEWQRITEELGTEQQLAAYKRSLGLEP